MTAGDTPIPLALRLEYDGTAYAGWARQPAEPSVQAALEDAFLRLGAKIEGLRCAGRTDAGVHATDQVVSCAYTGPIPLANLALALNGELPGDVAINALAVAPAEFDARNSALSRHYEYRVLPRRTPAPLRRQRVLHHPRPLDRGLLDACAAAVVGQHDFTAFTPSQTKHQYFHRTVLHSQWRERDDELVYEIAANAFLRHMVRVIMGTMLAVGRGDYEFEQFVELLAGAPRADAHNTAPAHALCLVRVQYATDPFSDALLR